MIKRLIHVREGVWRTEAPIQFSAFTLHAPGCCLKEIVVGTFTGFVNGPIMLSAPVRLVTKGLAGIYIVFDFEETDVPKEEWPPFVVFEATNTRPLPRRKVLRNIGYVVVDEDDE